MTTNLYLKLLQEILDEIRQSKPKRIMTVDEVAKYLGVSTSTVYFWTSKRLIPFSKLQYGRIIYFDRGKIEIWALSNEVQTQESLRNKALKQIKR